MLSAIALASAIAASASPATILTETKQVLQPRAAWVGATMTPWMAAPEPVAEAAEEEAVLALALPVPAATATCSETHPGTVTPADVTAALTTAGNMEGSV